MDVQLWYARTGGGHRRVAEAVRAALSEVGGPEVRVALDDPLDVGALPQARLLLDGYGPVVRVSPALWGFLFRAFSRPAARRSLELFLLSGIRAAMIRTTGRHRPRVVVNCHPLLGPAAVMAAREVGAPILTLITDLTLVHPGWLSPPGVPLLSPSPMATASCLRQGVEEALITTTGLPVDPRLEGRAAADRSGPRSALDLDPELPCVLVSGGAEGAGDVLRLLEEVERVEAPFQLILLSGRNPGLLRRARSRRWSRPLLALPYLEDPSPWLRAADVYVGKAGPSAISEGSACGLALLLTSALPGQERANLEWAVGAGVATATTAAGELAPALGSLLRSPERMEEAKRRSAGWREPGAAARAARAILGRL